MAYIGACGFECGAHVTGHFLLSGASFDTTTVRSGLRSLRVNGTTASQYGSATWATGTIMAWRIYVRFASLPTGDCYIAVDGSHKGGAHFKSSDSKIYAGANPTVTPGGATYGATGVAVTTNTWYRLDIRTDASSADALIDVQVDGAACGTKTVTGGGGTFSFETVIGQDAGGNSVTVDHYYDDLLISNSSAEYPLGAGYVLSYIPNADGSHNVAGSNDFERSLTGTDITNATTTAWQLIADRPLPTSAVDFINGIAPPNATDYVEWQYEDSVESVPPLTVDAIVVSHDAGGAGTNSYTVTLRESSGGTSADIFSGTQNNGASLDKRRRHFATVPGTATTWDTTSFNNLRSRFLVADASPDVYIDAAMLEAAFVPVVAGDVVPSIVRRQNYQQLLAH